MQHARSVMWRPWGWMVKLLHTRTLWVKLIRVYAGHRTSDQLHHERTEYHIRFPFFWRVRVVAVGERHRMEGGWYLEIATGNPREEDIERFADDYGRAIETVL